ncbi:MAG: hypothetical protein WA151_15280 [Desulfatirhabdiaceae bacterium]
MKIRQSVLLFGRVGPDRRILSGPGILDGIDPSPGPFDLARYYYYLQVPFHRTRKGYDIVLQHYLQELAQAKQMPISGIEIANSKLKIDFNAFQFFDDYSVFEKIKIDAVNENPWVKILLRQDRLHPIYDEEIDSDANRINFLDLIMKLESNELKKDQDFFVFNKRKGLCT